MSSSGIPQNYLDFNTQKSKNIVVLVKIAGVPDVICNTGLNTRILYGDPGITYGQAGLVYGGLRPYVAVPRVGTYPKRRAKVEWVFVEDPPPSPYSTTYHHGHIMIVATRTIREGDELFIHYEWD